MKNSTAVEVCSDPSSENYLDQDFLIFKIVLVNQDAGLLVHFVEKQLRV